MRNLGQKRAREESRLEAWGNPLGRKPIESSASLVARQRRLGLRAADQIVPMVAVEVLARDLDELMKVLEALLEIVVGHRRGPRSAAEGMTASVAEPLRSGNRGRSALGRHCEEQSDEAISGHSYNPARDCFAPLAMTVAAATLRLGSPAQCRYDSSTTTPRRGDAPSAPPHPHPKHPLRRNPGHRPCFDPAPLPAGDRPQRAPRSIG